MMTDNNDPLFNADLLQKAEQLLNQRLKNDPENRSGLRSLAELYRKLGKLAEARTAYEQLIHLDPQDQEAGYLQAVVGGKEWRIGPDGLRAAPFVLLKDFLPPEFHAGLLPFMISVKDKLVPGVTNVDTQGKMEYKPDFREMLALPGNWDGNSRFGSLLVKVLPQVVPRLGLAPFKINYVEIELRAYQDGHFLKVHMDAPPTSTRADRAISFVYYFHRRPRPYTGGELLLFDSDIEANSFTTTRYTRLVPEDNSLVIFPSNFYHCVVPIRCASKCFADSRFAIGGFIRKCTPVADSSPGDASGCTAPYRTDERRLVATPDSDDLNAQDLFERAMKRHAD
jgi:SM-20-related protein